MCPIILVMGLREIQEKTGVFEASNDALCFGLDYSELDYLKGIKVDAAVVDDRSSHDVSGKYNVMVIALDQGLFRVFGVIDEHIDALLLNAKIVLKLKIEGDLEDVRNIVARFSKPLNLQPEMYVVAEKNYAWIILSRM